MPGERILRVVPNPASKEGKIIPFPGNDKPAFPLRGELVFFPQKDKKDDNLRLFPVLKRLSARMREEALKEKELGLFGDDQLKNETPGNVVQLIKRKRVAKHELGHGLITKYLGGSAEMTVVPSGNTLGLTKSRLASRTKRQLVLDWITVSTGGEIGLDSSEGTGSDKASQKGLAELFVNAFEPDSSASQIISSQQSRAKGILAEYGDSYINDRANTLARKQSLSL